MRVRLLSLAVMLLVPSLAAAQGGGMGGMGGGRRRGGGMGGNEGGREAAPPKFPEAKDLQNYNPAAYLIDKRKKLSLADSQVAALKSLEGRIFERNAPLLVRYDSLRREYHPAARDANAAPATAPDSTRFAATMQVRSMRALLDSLSERRRT